MVKVLVFLPPWVSSDFLRVVPVPSPRTGIALRLPTAWSRRPCLLARPPASGLGRGAGVPTPGSGRRACGGADRRCPRPRPRPGRRRPPPRPAPRAPTWPALLVREGRGLTQTWRSPAPELPKTPGRNPRRLPPAPLYFSQGQPHFGGPAAA